MTNNGGKLPAGSFPANSRDGPGTGRQCDSCRERSLSLINMFSQTRNQQLPGAFPIVPELIRRVRGTARAPEPPLRGELFSVEQLTHHAKELAGQQKLGVKAGANRLLARLFEN